MPYSNKINVDAESSVDMYHEVIADIAKNKPYSNEINIDARSSEAMYHQIIADIAVVKLISNRERKANTVSYPRFQPDIRRGSSSSRIMALDEAKSDHIRLIFIEKLNQENRIKELEGIIESDEQFGGDKLIDLKHNGAKGLQKKIFSQYMAAQNRLSLIEKSYIYHAIGWANKYRTNYDPRKHSRDIPI